MQGCLTRVYRVLVARFAARTRRQFPSRAWTPPERLIRRYTDADLDTLKRLHRAQGFNYPFPENVGERIFLTKLVTEDDRGEVVMAALVRLTGEAYLLHDPRAGTPRERWERLLRLHEAVRRSAYVCGLEDVHCWLPPEVSRARVGRAFERRLRVLGWRANPWRCYSRPVVDPARDTAAALWLSPDSGSRAVGA